jgi:hypothetical protein
VLAHLIRKVGEQLFVLFLPIGMGEVFLLVWWNTNRYEKIWQVPQLGLA